MDLDIEKLRARIDADRNSFAVMRQLLADLLRFYECNETVEELAHDIQQKAITPIEAARWTGTAARVIAAHLYHVRNTIRIEILQAELMKRGRDGK